MEQGRRYEGKPNSAEVSTTEFERYAIRVETKEVAREPEIANSKSTKALLQTGSPADKAELQWRLAIPVSALILVLLAIPLSFVDPRAGRSLNVFFALVIYILYNNMLSICEAWVRQGRLNPLIGMWPIHLLFLVLAVYLFYRRIYLLPVVPAFLNVLRPNYWRSAK
jgi:lipopolysaccharide export system permease protein